MGRWTPQHYDILLADKLQLALRPALQNYEIKYETFVEELDGNDAVVQSLIDALVLDMVQQRARPSTPSSSGTSMRIANAARHVEACGTPHKRSLASTRARHHLSNLRGPHRVELFASDDDFDSFSPAPQVPPPTLPTDALESLSSSQNLYDAYDPHPQPYAPELVMASQDYWSAPGELQDVWDWQPSRGEPLQENPHQSPPPNPMEGSLNEREFTSYSRPIYGRQQISPSVNFSRHALFRRLPRRYVADFIESTSHPSSYSFRRSSRSQHRTSLHPSRSWVTDRELVDSADATDNTVNSNSPASNMHRLRHLEAPNNIPSTESGSPGLTWPIPSPPVLRRSDSAGNPDPSTAAPRNWRSGGRTPIFSFSFRPQAEVPSDDPASPNEEVPLASSYPPRLPTPRSLSPNPPPSEGVLPTTPLI